MLKSFFTPPKPIIDEQTWVEWKMAQWKIGVWKTQLMTKNQLLYYIPNSRIRKQKKIFELEYKSKYT